MANYFIILCYISYKLLGKTLTLNHLFSRQKKGGFLDRLKCSTRYKQSLLENPSLGIQNEEWLQESFQLTSIILDAEPV
jgi:hypothetical protein